MFKITPKLLFVKASSFLGIGLVCVLFFNSCNRPKDLSEEEIYSILNEIIRDDSLDFNSVCWQYDSMRIYADAMENFSEADVEFYQRQRSRLMSHDIKPNKLKYYNRRYKDFIFSEIDSNTENGFHTQLDFPLITPDRKRVFLGFCENCNMILGGNGGQVLYEKKNGHWTMHSSYNFWISDNRRNQRKQFIAQQ